MPSENDILKQISSAEAAWDETPPAGAWERLESMLEAGTETPPPRGKVIAFRKWRGPLLLVLLLMVSTGVIWFLKGSDKPLPDQNQSLGEVETFNKKKVSNKVSQLKSSNLNLGQGNPVEKEGLPLLPERQDSTPNREHLVALIPSMGIPSESLAVTPPRAARVAADLGAYPYNPELEYVQTMEFPGEEVDPAVSNLAMNSIFDNGNWSPQVAHSVSNTGNFLSYTPGPAFNWNPEKTVDIGTFNFLLGSWRRMGPSGSSHEEWEKNGDLSMKGRGYFVVNGDTVVTDRMEIREMEDGLYYIVAIDSSRKPHKFKLRSVGPSGAVFENPALGFPRQVVVSAKPDGSVTSILRNPSDSSSIPAHQQPLMEQSNYLNSRGEAVRSLVRDQD